MLISDHDLFERIETEKGFEAAEKFANCLSDIPEHKLDKMIKALNQCLVELGILVEIIDVLPTDVGDVDVDYVWVYIDKTPIQHHQV